MRDAGMARLLASLILIFLPFINAINWDEDIIASPLEVQNEKLDALSHYFGSQIQNETIFRSKEAMQKIVGEFEDVPKER